jgi:hypothetical protein
MEKLSPVALEVAQLDDVDRNLIQQVSHKWLEGVAYAAKAEALAAREVERKERHQEITSGITERLSRAARELFFSPVLLERVGLLRLDRRWWTRLQIHPKRLKVQKKSRISLVVL